MKIIAAILLCASLPQVILIFSYKSGENDFMPVRSILALLIAIIACVAVP